CSKGGRDKIKLESTAG
nr:ribosomal protein L33 {N-terminal} [Burkholderia pickettii, Peptide Partial, 16 aa] [Ralstonia pickettii]